MFRPGRNLVFHPATHPGMAPEPHLGLSWPLSTGVYILLYSQLFFSFLAFLRPVTQPSGQSPPILFLVFSTDLFHVSSIFLFFGVKLSVSHPTGVLLFVWVITFHLAGMGDPAVATVRPALSQGNMLCIF